MGGKTATSTQQVSIPPEVLAQYQSVNARANATANTPFQTYGGEFVSPVNQQQATGIAGTNTAATEAQPYFDAATGQLTSTQANTTGVNNAATGLAASSAGAVDPSNLDSASINKYLSPYLSSVLGSTAGLINQNNAQAQSGALGTAIQSGAFGGDRTGVAAANLQQQQDLAAGNIYANIANTGYDTALSTAQQQQGVGLAAGQANRAARAAAGQELSGIGATTYGEGANTATTLAGLGTGAQTAGLQGANAQIAAGTVEQQTQQAQDTALYNQFLQQQSYPFQVDQFLANIAEGTGALSGSTTTTQQPGGFFSDRKLKHDIKKIGETFDHQDIYSYKMHGDPRTHIGLIAQKVEKKHPDSVGVAGGYKIVDYGKATEEAANRGHFYSGGVVPIRRAYAYGGGPSIVSPADLSSILEAQERMYAPMSGSAGVYGGPGGSVPRGGSGRVPPPSGATPQLVTARGDLKAQPTGLQNAAAIGALGKQANEIYQGYRKDHPKHTGVAPPSDPVPAATPGDELPVQRTVTTTTPGGLADANLAPSNDAQFASRGGVAGYARGGRPGYDDGGATDFDSILAAQQNMYRPQHAQSRDIPGQNHGAPSLAVASGSPAPPPSGSSNLNTTLGLGQKGYQAYRHFNSPKTGVNGGQDLTSNATIASAPESDPSTISGLSSTAPTSGAGLDTAAASDAAGAGAGAGAEAGAADAAAGAGAGAAAGAGAEAAGAGAADAAAALAAEYAAAEAASAVAAAAIAAKRGGRIRKKYDAGGMPYSAPDGSLDIPDTETSSHLQTAGPIKKQPTGLQTAMTLGDPEKAGGIMGSMFSNQALSSGGVAGRRGYDDGGDVDPTDDPNYQPSGVARGKINRTGSNLMYTRDAGSSMPHADRPFNPIVDHSLDDARDAMINTDPYAAAGDYKYNSETVGGPTLGTNTTDTRSPNSWDNAPSRPAPTGLGAASTQGPPTPTRTNDPVSYTGGVDMEQPTAPEAPEPGAAKTPGWWDRVKGVLKDSGLTKSENLIPLLTGIAAMGTAPTRSLGVALASGLGAGAQSYLPTREAQADIAQTKASTQLTGAQTQGVQVRNLAELQAQYALHGFALQEDPTGPVIGPDGKHYKPVPKASMVGNGQPGAPPQYSYLGKNGLETAKGEGVRFTTADEGVKGASGKQIDDVYQQGNAAQQNMLNIQRWEQSVAANPAGPLAPGALNENRLQAVNLWNTAMDQAGRSELKINGLGDAQMAEKTSRGAAAMSENEHQQRSFGALKAFLQSTPNTGMQRDAALNLISDLHTENQHAIDRKNYIDEFDKENQRNFGAPVPRNYLATDALQAFDKDYPSNGYQGERNKLSTLIQSGGFAAFSRAIQNADPKDRPAMYEKIDKKYGPNFHRYFTGS